MLARTLIYIAVGCCALIIGSFGMFALDQVSGASTQQVQQLASDAGDSVQSAAVRPEAQPRKFIDGAASTLTSPFSAALSSSDSRWAQRAAVTLLGLLVYGFGLGYLARFSRGLA